MQVDEMRVKRRVDGIFLLGEAADQRHHGAQHGDRLENALLRQPKMAGALLVARVIVENLQTRSSRRRSARIRALTCLHRCSNEAIAVSPSDWLADIAPSSLLPAFAPSALTAAPFASRVIERSDVKQTRERSARC